MVGGGCTVMAADPVEEPSCGLGCLTEPMRIDSPAGHCVPVITAGEQGLDSPVVDCVLQQLSALAKAAGHSSWTQQPEAEG